MNPLICLVFATKWHQIKLPKQIYSDLFDSLAVVIAGGETLYQAQPLVTHHYLKGLKRPGEDEGSAHDGAESTKEAFAADTRLLLVEDNYINQAVALAQLQALDLNCDVAGNGIEALQALKQSPENAPYHLIFMDCQMPDMDGYEATQEIRKGKGGERYLEIPIVAMTANAMEGDREKCLYCGMSDYVSKPINPEIVEGKLRRWLLEDEEDGG
jgi:two-component system sensor histidine kinase/response regulator